MNVPPIAYPSTAQPRRIGMDHRGTIGLHHGFRFLAAAAGGLLLAAILGAMVSAEDAQGGNLRRIDDKRQLLLKQLQQLRANEVNRMVYLTRSVELFKDLCMLDYDDPRTPLGGALAMNNISSEELTTIVFDMVLGRDPTEEEVKKCVHHFSTQKMGRKEAIHDIVWALCNSKEFIDRLKGK